MKKDFIKILKPFSIALVIVVLIVELITFSSNCFNKDIEKTKGYLQNGEYSKAVSLCLDLIERDVNDTAELYLLCSDIYTQAQDYNSAATILQKAIETGITSHKITEKINTIDTSKESVELPLTNDYETYTEKSIDSFVLCFFVTLSFIPIIIVIYKKCEQQCNFETVNECVCVHNKNIKTTFDEWFISKCNKETEKQVQKVEIEEEQKVLTETKIDQSRKKIIKIVTNNPEPIVKKVKNDKRANIKLVPKPQKVFVDYEKYHTELLSNPKVNKSYVKLIEKLKAEDLFQTFVQKRMDYNFIINKAIENGEISMAYLQNCFKMDPNTAKLYIIILQETGVVENDINYNKPRKTLVTEAIDISSYRLMYQNILKKEQNEIVVTDNNTSNKLEDVLNEIDNLTTDGWAFEKFSAELLLKNGFKRADVTSGSNDYGVDIIATDEHGVKYAIQCKCYSHILDNSAVQEVIAGQTMYKCQVAVVMTNQYFTDNAKILAKNNNVLLWDRNKLIEFIENANMKVE